MKLTLLHDYVAQLGGMSQMSLMQPSLSNAEYQMRKLVAVEGELMCAHLPWMWENDRWKELVAILLAHSIPEQPADMRSIVARLDHMGFLEVSGLARLIDDHQLLNAELPLTRHITEFLQEHGFNAGQCERAVLLLSELARSVTQHFDGKIQKYLRHYGELLLSEIDKCFSLTALPNGEIRKAFTIWFQNVLNLPVALLTDDVKNFCAEKNITTDELFAAADGLDINFAIVDELVHLKCTQLAFDKRNITKDHSGEELNG